jgi:hypothetical protein
VGYYSTQSVQSERPRAADHRWCEPRVDSKSAAPSMGAADCHFLKIKGTKEQGVNPIPPANLINPERNEQKTRFVDRSRSAELL